MKFLYCFIFLGIFSFSCKDNGSNGENLRSVSENRKVENQECKEKSYDSFDNFKINGIQVSEFNIEKFIENNKKPDSIKDGYYFYGKSNFLFEKDKVIFIEIVDKGLHFDDLLSIKTSFQEVKNKFPCSFKNRTNTEYHYTKAEAINLYDENYNKIKIFVSNEKILGIVYMIDESDFDRMNQ
jgi:hypothetical protein